MDRARWKKVEEIFHSALEVDEKDRSAFLAKACGDDLDLRAEVESLIPEYEETDGFLGESLLNAGLAALAEHGELPAQAMIGKYEVKELIARGGTGSVYLATDVELGRPTALKILRSGVLPGNTEGAGRFEREVRAAASISHPNVAHIYGAGRFQEMNYIAMEYVQGVSLRQMLKAGALPFEKAINIGCQVAKALAAAHRVGIIHRDIKPENIIVCEEALVKVLDFGLAKITGAKSFVGSLTGDVMFRTPPGLVMGTLGYMSPEQVRGQEVDARTDVWSLGIVLFEMLAGKRPFHGDSETDTLTAILTDEPDPPVEIGSRLAPQATTIVRKCLAKEPAERFQSAADLALVLRALSVDLRSGVVTKDASHKITEKKHAALNRWMVVPLLAAAAAVAYLLISNR